LKEVSSLGPYSIDIAEVDLSQLLGDKAFILSYIVSNNRLDIKTSFFINTGVNRYTFINSKFIRIIK
jgi:hypothetical protein